MDPRRRILCAMAAAALERVGGRAAVRRALAGPDSLQYGDPLLHGPATGAGVAVIAIGKAAEAMLQGAEDALGTLISRAIVITRDGGSAGPATSARPSFAERPTAALTERLHTSHPIPDARSVAAGERLFAWIAELRAEEPVLLLISGGASSLIELPRPGVTLQQIQALTERGLRTGLDIAALNAERARLSWIKGGGLTAALAGHAGRALFISDVPGDDPAVIGSGLAGPLASVSGDRLQRAVVANVEAAVGAASAWARGIGLVVEAPPDRFAGPAADLGRSAVASLRAGRAQAWVLGGETVVQLPPHPGRGGRNQQVALAAALEIRGDPELFLLALGTDGNDGPTEDAGGLVDGATCGRIAAANLDPVAALAGADAGTALEAAGDLVTTGPTGTNVGDLVLALRLRETQAAELLASHGEVPVPML